MSDLRRRFCLALFSAVLGFLPTAIADRQTLSGHVPLAVWQLQPKGRLPATQVLRLGLSLPLKNQADLTNLLQRLYDPASPDFHQFLTANQFASRFGPSAEDYQALIDFAKANGLEVSTTHSNRTLLDVQGPVSTIEKVLGVTLRTYPHPAEARDFFAPDAEPSLDAPVPVLHIGGLDNFLTARPMNVKTPSAISAGGSGPGGTFVGNDFRAAYVPGTTLTGTGQVVGLVEFDGYFPADVAAYRNLALIPNIPLKNVLLDEFNGIPGGNNSEVALDIDMASSMAPDLSAIIVYEGSETDDVLNRIATDNLAKQISASWLYSIDAGTEQIFQQFAAQGQSFFNASGDYDAYVGSVETPADDPNITIVGGTTLSTSGPGGTWAGETVWNWGGGTGTGGGISTAYPIPAWQQGINMTVNGGSTNKRNLPDVTLTADNVWVIYDNGATGGFGGTSCATPLWAGFTALANQQALANGRTTQGFINPAIYAIGKGANYAAGFHDITNGNNTSPSSPSNYYATAGFDLCTGWGTPNGTNLINLLAPPDALRITPAAGFAALGGVGGPFTMTSETFSLTNTGATNTSWSIGITAPWLNASPTGGTLPGGATATIFLNAAASNQVAGTYSATVWFTNLSDGFVQSRTFALDVITPPQITGVPTNESVLGGATVIFKTQAVGGAPLAYQWRQNGASLNDGNGVAGSATTALTIASVAASNVGSYTVVVSNAAASATSAPPAVLSIIPSSPVIVTQPISQFALVGDTVNFNVSALGSGPLAYQWLFNSAILPGATTSSLTLAPVTAASAGTYSVMVSNALDSVASTNAVLSVYAQADMQLLQNGGFETGDFSFWNQTGNTSLDSISANSLFDRSGLYGAEMGPVGALGYISQTVSTTSGANYLLSFWLDSPDGSVPNEFLVNWNGYNLIDSTNMPAFGWSNFQFVVTATAGNTTVEFGFRDDNSFLGFDDASLQPLLNPSGAPVITAQPPGEIYATIGGSNVIAVTATGLSPLSYQWQSNNAPISGATGSVLAFPSIIAGQGAIYSVVVSNTLGSVVSSNSILTILPGVLTTVTFDDLGLTNEAVPNGYANLDWSNFYDTDPLISSPNPSGYIAGIISPPNVAYNDYGQPASITNAVSFSLLSAWMTAAWNNDLRLEVRGYASDQLIYDKGFNLSATAPALIDFDCIDVTNVEFISSGGTPDSNYSVSGTEFVIDNAGIVITPPPPPANDLCGGALVVSTDPYTNTQSTLGATSAGDPVPGCLTNFANGVWYQFTPAANGQLEVDTSGSDFNAALAVYSGSCGSLTPVACEANALSVTSGVNYYILAGAAGNLTGNLVFHLSFTSATTGPPLVLTQPTNLSVVFASNATFSVNAEGARPLTYIWQRNGTNIAGATGATFILTNVQIADSGAQFSCVVSNSAGVTNSVAATLTVTPPGQLVQNGGFETGDFSFWSLSGNTQDCAVNTLDVHSGKYGAQLGPYGSLGYISQTFATSASQTYLLSLWLFNPPSQTPNEFSVAWNGTTYFDQTNLGGLNWSNLLLELPSTTTNGILKIGFRDDPSYLGLDDITVLPMKPILQSVKHNSGAITFNWSALPGYQYQVQSSTNLSQANWTNLGAVTATNYLMPATESIGTGKAQFFRVVLTQ